jgi:hypothetical protein
MKNVIAIVCAAAALQLPLSAQSKLPPSAQRTFSDPSTYAPDLSERDQDWLDADRDGARAADQPAIDAGLPRAVEVLWRDAVMLNVEC